MKTKKALALLMCAVLLVVSTVFVTVAFLTSQDEVKNTFTVGNVVITLDEADVDDSDEDGNTTERDKANEYKLIPGKTYDKDPTIHVAGNEDCYLFVKVENGIADIEGENTIAVQMAAKGWYAVEGVAGVYYYGVDGEKAAVAPGANQVVFEKFTVAGDVDNDTVAEYEDAVINVYAYAIQADGLEGKTPAELWTNFSA